MPKPRRPTAVTSASQLADLETATAGFSYYTPDAAEALSGDMRAIISALPAGISPDRLTLFRKVFRDWWESDLQRHLRHFSDASRAVDLVRGAMLDRVSKAAGNLCDALAALDHQGRAQVGFWAVVLRDFEGKIRSPTEAEEWLATATGRNPPAAVEWLERFVERRPGRVPQWPVPAVEWLAELAAIGGHFDKEKPRSSWRHQSRGHPRALLSDAVMFDLAALFEWVSGTEAQRRVHNKDHTDAGKDYGPFFEFSQVVWRLVFGSGAGLSRTTRKWANARQRSDANSAAIANIASRHPEWRLFDENS